MFGSFMEPFSCKYQLNDWRQTSFINIKQTGTWTWLAQDPIKVKCLVYCEMCECIYNFIQWKNRVRTLIFGFGFWSVLYGVGVRYEFLHIFTFSFGFRQNLGSGWFVLAAFGFFLIFIQYTLFAPVIQFLDCLGAAECSFVNSFCQCMQCCLSLYMLNQHTACSLYTTVYY